MTKAQNRRVPQDKRHGQEPHFKKNPHTILVYKEMCDKKDSADGCERTRLRKVLRTVLRLHEASLGLTSCLHSSSAECE